MAKIIGAKKGQIVEDQSERVIFFEGQIQKIATVRYVLVEILDAYKTYKPASTSSHCHVVVWWYRRCWCVRLWEEGWGGVIQLD